MTGMAEEGRRQSYLAALGVPVWTARFPMPSAAASQTLTYVPYGSPDIDEEVETISGSLEACFDEERLSGDSLLFDEGPPLEAYQDDPEFQAPAKRGPVSASNAIVTEVTPVPREPAQLRNASRPLAGVNELLDTNDQPVQFRFALFRCDRTILIVPRYQLLSPSEDKLLRNILLASANPSAQPVPFAWPMVNNPAIPQHRRAAEEALRPFLARQTAQARCLVILGEHEQDLSGMLTACSALPVALQPGLGQMLQQPIRKRELWLAIRG